MTISRAIIFFLISALTIVKTYADTFDKTLKLQGVSFHVQCTNEGSINRLVITPEGLKTDSSSILHEIDGSVTSAEVGDLNVDGSPEIYIYINSSGSGSYGSLIAYAVNQKKTMTEITLPELLENKEMSEGYLGHDEFTLLENTLGRRFPIYKPDDINAKPTGGIRQIEYKLYKGEAGWLLKIDRSIELMQGNKK